MKLMEPTFGDEEIVAAVEVLRSTWVTSGERVKEFESKFGGGVMSNSGSSANLLAIAALCHPLTESGLHPGDEVIVSALSWSTTVWPLVQHGLVPVIVDIDPDTLNIDPEEIKKAIGPKTRAIMPVHVYGNPCDMNAIMELADDFSLVVIEDCCEALGANVGQGDIQTFSFYFSHHITTLEGGMTVTENEGWDEVMRIVRAHGWVRDLSEGRRDKYEARYPHIDPRFLFVGAGYNLRATELQAAIGLVQLPKLERIVAHRQLVAARLREVLRPLKTQEDSGSSWFGFPILDPPAGLRRFFDINSIETRPIICGNIARQPGMQLYDHRVVGKLPNADHVMEKAFSIGCHHKVGDADINHVRDVWENFS